MVDPGSEGRVEAVQESMCAGVDPKRSETGVT